jgi:hypothetical protein
MRSAPCDRKDPSMRAARADALFASTLQRSDEPTALQVERAIAAATRTFGDVGCAARVAQEYGEHPETAASRMQWARMAADGSLVRRQIRGTSPGTAEAQPRVMASLRRSPRSRSAAACA